MRPPGCLDDEDSGALAGHHLDVVDDDDDDDDVDREPDFGMVDMSSWKTNSFNSFGVPPDGGLGPMAGFPYPGFPGQMPMAPYGPMAGMGVHSAPFFGSSAAELEAQAAELDYRAQQLKQAAQQAELAAQQARSSVSNSKASTGSSGGGGAAAYPGMFVGAYPYHDGHSAMMLDPHWGTQGMMGMQPANAKQASSKARPKKAITTPGKSVSPTSADEFTTLMLRNIPNNYNREMVLELLDLEGFAKRYDFVYLPMDFHRMAGLGYAFVNLVDHQTAEEVKAHFSGYSSWRLASQKICEVSWGEPLQGLEAHIERYRNSPVMHEEVPDKYKPVLYRDGQRIEFPAPTKRIRPPRVKKSGGGGGGGVGKSAGGDEGAEDF